MFRGLEQFVSVLENNTNNTDIGFSMYFILHYVDENKTFRRLCPCLLPFLLLLAAAAAAAIIIIIIIKFIEQSH